MKRVTLKLGNIRKAKDWVVYPKGPGSISVTIQCNDRIAQIEEETRKGMLSKAKSGGAYFIDLMPFRGATPVEVTPDQLAEKVLVEARLDEVEAPIYEPALRTMRFILAAATEKAEQRRKEQPT